MCVVDDAVEDSIGQGRVADQVVPAIDRNLAGDQRRAAAVAVLDDLEEIVALLRTERFEPLDLLCSSSVQDQQLHAAERPHQPGVATIATGQCQIGEQSRDALIEHGVIVATGAVPEGAGEP